MCTVRAMKSCREESSCLCSLRNCGCLSSVCTCSAPPTQSRDVATNNETHLATPKPECSWVDDYNRINSNLSTFVNVARAYANYREKDKEAMSRFKSTTEQLVESYTENMQSRIENCFGKTMDVLKLAQRETSREDVEARVRALKEERNNDICPFIDQQTTVLSNYLQTSVAQLNQSLQQNITQFYTELQSRGDTLLPSLSPSKYDLSSLYKTVRQFITEGFGKEQKDWVPYPQLYPPGTLIHMRNNTSIGKRDDYELLEAVADRLEKKEQPVGMGKEENVELVEVEKSEVDHYSMDSSLIEDHRMGNYVWGLCKYYDSHKRDSSFC